MHRIAGEDLKAGDLVFRAHDNKLYKVTNDQAIIQITQKMWRTVTDKIETLERCVHELRERIAVLA